MINEGSSLQSLPHCFSVYPFISLSMSAQKESIQETGVQEPIVKEENTKDSFKDKDVV